MGGGPSEDESVERFDHGSQWMSFCVKEKNRIFVFTGKEKERINRDKYEYSKGDIVDITLYK